MRLYSQTVLGLALTALVVPVAMPTVQADRPVAQKSAVKPDVAALLKQSTDVYKKMKSYRHTAVFVIAGKNPETGAALRDESRFTLALERPNKFVYKNDTKPVTAAVSDGKTFINFKGEDRLQYTRQNAPADFKGINIVDDVTFTPLATYIIALMLQGDALADKDVRGALEKATLKPGVVTENGKKWQVLSVPFGEQDPTDVYFNAEDHLIGKAVQRGTQFEFTVTETYENLSINKPIEGSVFQYAPPAQAKRVDKFLPIQKPDDARSTPRRASRPVLTSLRGRR
jgi:outer membrane lipoprotein-sorting protein